MKNSPSASTVVRLLVLGGALASLGASANPTVVSYDEGAFFDNLRQIQSSTSTAPAMHGAQGPIRSDFSDSPRFSYEESAFYDNLRILQERSTSDMTGAQAPVASEYKVAP